MGTQFDLLVTWLKSTHTHIQLICELTISNVNFLKLTLFWSYVNIDHMCYKTENASKWYQTNPHKILLIDTLIHISFRYGHRVSIKFTKLITYRFPASIKRMDGVVYSHSYCLPFISFFFSLSLFVFDIRRYLNRLPGMNHLDITFESGRIKIAAIFHASTSTKFVVTTHTYTHTYVHHSFNYVISIVDSLSTFFQYFKSVTLRNRNRNSIKFQYGCVFWIYKYSQAFFLSCNFNQILTKTILSLSIYRSFSLSL